MKRVVVAMSGGVDSSVSASMLVEKGYEVIGITMQLWPREENGDRPICCGVEAIESARKVSNQLGIPHYVIDIRDVFREKVIKDFCTEYSLGRTPNPCIRCNQYIKFDVLLRKAKALGADFISTGHYARILFDKTKQRYLIKKGLSLKNDQSYVLYTLTQAQLTHTIFPLGEFSKEKVRDYARHKGLDNSNRSSSQEICFTGSKDYREFLVEFIKEDIKPGPIVNNNSDVIGQHKGLPFYTIGQREGLGISFGYPLYVIKIDKENNRLIVGSRDSVYSSECEIEGLNLILYERLESSIMAKVKIRYQYEPKDAEVIPIGDNRCRVIFDEPQRAITPGQAAVFYDGDVVVGGGTIK